MTMKKINLEKMVTIEGGKLWGRVRQAAASKKEKSTEVIVPLKDNPNQ